MYYILPSTAANAASNDYRIMQVKPGDEAAFLATYGPQVLAQGSCIAEALQRFHQWLNRQ
jgi:hypothetical protein